MTTTAIAEPASGTQIQQRSAELLRLTIPVMSKHAAGFDPFSYAIWYDYVSGGNPKLKAEIDRLIASIERLNATQTEDLYRRHVVERGEESVLQARTSLTSVLDRTQESMQSASTEAGQFGTSLSVFSEKVVATDDKQGVSSLVKDLSGEVQRMRQSLEALSAQLEESRGDIDKLSNELRRARDNSYLDPLTGISNRRALDEALAEQCLLTLTNGQPLCIVMVDIDHFKRVNDRAGHIAGDRVIRVIAQHLQASVKRQDVVARYGGEEFMLILPATPLAGALTLTERLRADIEKTSIATGSAAHPALKVTVSAGIAQQRLGETPESLVGRADKALYVSKQSGRNRVTVDQ
ncbi:MAG: diguanylate cyclase [Lautropia sp.]